MATAIVNVRVPAAERAALRDLADRTGLSQSDLVRAGIRAVVANPGLVVMTVPLDGHDAPVVADPPPPPPRRRRRKR